jgi:hypothetical protein
LPEVPPPHRVAGDPVEFLRARHEAEGLRLARQTR